MTQLPLDTSIQAEYADGFILDETEHDDVSPYTGVNNIFNDVLEKRPEAEHGQMVRFSVFYHDTRYDIDWRDLPTNARPIRFRDRSAWIDESGATGMTDWQGCRFGYQYNDEAGRNVKEVREL